MNLDRRKQYVGIEIGDSRIARLIQFQTANISNLPVKETASHIFGIVYVNREWTVYESHFSSKGVTKYPLKKYLKQNKSKFIQFIEYKLNKKALEYYYQNNPGYGIWDIFTKAFNLFDKNNGMGLICSEYIAIGMDFDICSFFNLPAHVITPAHYQVFFSKKLL